MIIAWEIPAVLDTDVIDEVKKAIHEYGTPSFKIFLFYDFRVDDYAMIRLLEETKKHGGLVQVHAESFDMIRRLAFGLPGGVLVTSSDAAADAASRLDFGASDGAGLWHSRARRRARRGTASTR